MFLIENPISQISRIVIMMLAALGLTMPFHAKAQQRFENLDRLDGLVATTAGAGIGQPGGAVAPIDRRLRLAPCPSLPQVDPPALGAVAVSCPALGWRLRVPLLAGGEIASALPPGIRRAPTATAPQPVVRKGDPVQLMAGDGSFTVSRAMIADEDGVAGATIRVRQDPRSPPVSARVEGAGMVRIPGV